jgi:hypothetical protein
MREKKQELDKSKNVVIIIRDAKQEYNMELPRAYSGKIILSFQKGILQGGRREHNFAPSEIDRSLK